MSSTPFRKIGANISWLLFDRVFRMVVGVVTLAVVARHLGTAEFGDLNFSINLVALLTSPSNGRRLKSGRNLRN